MARRPPLSGILFIQSIPDQKVKLRPPGQAPASSSKQGFLPSPSSCFQTKCPSISSGARSPSHPKPAQRQLLILLLCLIFVSENGTAPSIHTPSQK